MDMRATSPRRDKEALSPGRWVGLYGTGRAPYAADSHSPVRVVWAPRCLASGTATGSGVAMRAQCAFPARLGEWRELSRGTSLVGK